MLINLLQLVCFCLLPFPDTLRVIVHTNIINPLHPIRRAEQHDHTFNKFGPFGTHVLHLLPQNKPIQ